MSNFEVSAIIPAFNVEEHIAATIQSVLDQTCPVKEIIVVDDGSTDKTAEAVKGFPQVKYIYQENAGVSVARNTGINASKGNWIAFLDGDDIWLPEKIKKQFEIITSNPDLVWAAGNYIVKDFRKNTEKANVCLKEAKSWANNGVINYFQHWKHFGITSNVILKKEAFYEAGKFRKGMTRTEDTDLWLRVAYRHPEVGFTTEPCLLYNFFRDGSSNHERSQNSRVGFKDTLDVMEKHLTISAKHNRSTEFKVILRNILKGMARRSCRTKQFDLAEIILNKFAREISFHTKIYLYLNLIKSKLMFWNK